MEKQCQIDTIFKRKAAHNIEVRKFYPNDFTKQDKLHIKIQAQHLYS